MLYAARSLRATTGGRPNHGAAMQHTTKVDRTARKRLRVVSTKYPSERVALLEAVRERRGDDFVSQTVRAALDGIIEKHFPGATQKAA